jgi:hypothetical protein
MEEALSLGDALSIRIIIFLLLVIFLVPLVQVGKIRLAKIKKDDFWPHLATWVQSAPQELPDAYWGAFEWPTDGVVRTLKTPQATWWIAWQNKDSVIFALRQDAAQGFVTLRSERFQATPILAKGKLAWSAPDAEWFAKQRIPLAPEDSLAKIALSELRQALPMAPKQ